MRKVLFRGFSLSLSGEAEVSCFPQLYVISQSLTAVRVVIRSSSFVASLRI